MNASRLREITDLLLEKEQQFKIQEILTELSGHLSNLASNPQDAAHQNNFAAGLEKLKVAIEGLSATLQPAQIKLLEEIDADKFFTGQMFSEIIDWVQKNPLTPAVAHQKLGAFVASRKAFIRDITELRTNLEKLKIRPSVLSEGATEIGFLIPRSLFSNQFDEFIKEMNVLRRVLQAFAETATGAAQPIVVGDISTTDPQLFLGIDPLTAAMFGGVITWALSQWKKVEEIRKLRSETKKNSSFTEEEIKFFYDSKIEKIIDEAIEEKTGALLKAMKASGGRDHEKRNELTWALRSILARIERGMTVEIRFLPPESKSESEGKQEATALEQAFSSLAQTAPQLLFPASEKAPVLQIPPPEPEEPQRSSKTS